MILTSLMTLSWENMDNFLGVPMKSFTKFAFVVSICGMFLACGSDSGSNSSGSELPRSIASINEIFDYECNGARQCAKLYVEEYSDTMQCVNGIWETLISSMKNACADSSANQNGGSAEESSAGSSSVIPGSSSGIILSSSSGVIPGFDVESSAESSVEDGGTEGALTSSGSVIPEFSSSSLDDEVGVSSSSSVLSSSSQSRMGNSKYDAKTKTLLDYRDNQSYRTVSIQGVVWMAENLNYAYNEPTAELDSSSFCYKNSADSCSKYGRLYLWSAAMDSSAVFSDEGKGCGNEETSCSASGNIHGVCPGGWHLPSKAEWDSLFASVEGAVGTKLKATSGWYSFVTDGNGDDYYGFSVLPAGSRSSSGSFTTAVSYAYFWSSTEYEGNESHIAYSWKFFSGSNAVDENRGTKDSAYSVRCVKD